MKIALSSLLVVACATTPVPTPIVTAPVPVTITSDNLDGDVRDVRLSSGLRILLKEDHSAPVATLAVYYGVGSRQEDVGITGSAHLLEHLLFKGSRRFAGKSAVWGGLSRIGSSFNATTHYDRTNYFETLPIEHLPFAVALEADRMRFASFTDADRQSEMTVVRNELERGENEPGRVLNQAMWASAFASHPYHHPVIGWRSDVETMPTSLIRNYYEKYYQPDNAVVVLVGDVERDAALKLLVAAFGEHARSGLVVPTATVEEPQKGERRVTIRKPGEIAMVSIGWKLPGAMHPDAVPLKVLQLVLSGTLDVLEFGDSLDPGIGNRLYQSMVESQLTTGAGMSYQLLRDASLATITARLRPGVEHKVVEDAIRKEISRLKTEPLTDAELARSKKRARAAFALSADGTFGQATTLGYFAMLGDWRFARDFTTKIDAVTAADVQRVAKAYFDDDAATVGWYVPVKRGEAPKASTGWLPANGAQAYSSGEELPGAGGEVPKGATTPTTRKIQKKTLENGLRIVVVENPTSGAFALSGTVLAGGIHEKQGESGLASLTAAMLERGTATRTKRAIADELEGTGASRGYGGGFESASISALALGEDLPRILGTMAEEMMTPAFDAGELEKLKSERLARLQQAEDSTRTRGSRALYQGLYPKGHPMYSDDLADALAMTKAVDVAAVKRFHQAFWGPDRTILVLVGNVEAEAVFRIVQEKFGSWKRVGGPAVSMPDVPRREKADRVVVVVPEKPNADIMLAHQTQLRRTDPDYYPAMLANYVVGGAVSSRLFEKVRNDLGLTYGIGSGLSAGKLPGPWTISLSVNPNAVDQAIAATLETLKIWAKDGITAQELADAKLSLTGKFKVGLATSAGLAGVYATYETLGLGAEFAEEHPKRIEAVTLEEIRAAIAKHYAPDALLTVVAGSVPAK